MTDFNQKTHDTDVGSHGGQSRQMMEVFENQEFGSIRLLQEAGKTFFCASDVAKALGYVNPYAAVKRHCRGPLTKREGVVQKVNQYGDAGEQVVEISFITEGDVYRLIVHSKLPSAERFEHWVFDEVLPSIRKHGVYMSDSILDQVIQHPEVIYTLAQELVAEREQLEGIRKQLDAAQPKADYFDTFVNSEDCTCIRNFCKEIGIPEKTAVALLLDHRYLQASPSLSQAQRLKKLSQEGGCTLDAMCEVMNEIKKDELDHVTIKNEVLRKYFPKSYTPKQMQDTIIRLLEKWQRSKQRDMER